jgi:hypothetical protein
VFLFGGLAYDGGKAGGFAVNVSNAWSYDYVNIAGRLAY